MTAVGAERKQVNLIAPVIAEAGHDRSFAKFGLQIPVSFQCDALARANPVVNHFSAGGRELSIHDDLEALSLLLKDPRIHDAPSAHKPDAIVLQKIAWRGRSSMLFEIAWRGTYDALCRQYFFRDHTGVRWEANSKSHI